MRVEPLRSVSFAPAAVFRNSGKPFLDESERMKRSSTPEARLPSLVRSFFRQTFAGKRLFVGSGWFLIFTSRSWTRHLFFLPSTVSGDGALAHDITHLFWPIWSPDVL